MEYKFIHILWKSAAIFSPKIINLINENFDQKEHLFVCTQKKLYEQFEKCENVVFYKCKKNYSAEVINHFAPLCKALFVHSMCPPLEFAKIKKKYLSKIYVRTWGTDIGYTCRSGEPFKNLFKKIINALLKKRYEKLGAIGIANVVDKVKLDNYIDFSNYFYGSYASKESYMVSHEIVNSLRDVKKRDDIVNVMVGHSAYKSENHIRILKKLKVYKDFNIKIYIPISYGDKKYIMKVKSFALKTFGDKVVFLEELMPLKDYAEFLSGMDIAILNGESSYALGNINILLKCFKKIYLNKKGVIYQTFISEKLPTTPTSVLGKEDFATFSKLFDKDNFNEESTLMRFGVAEEQIKEWQRAFDFMEKN